MTLRSRLSSLPDWLKKVLSYLGVLVFWVGAWWLAARRVDEAILLPDPFSVVQRLFALAITSDFWLVVMTSLLRILAGILIGTVAGGLLSLITHFVPPLYTLFYPLISVIRSTPVASFIILAYLWIGRDSLPTFISVLLVLPVVWANLHEALGAVDRDLLDMAKVFRFSPWQKLRRVYLPAVVPAFLASCRSSVGLAWKAGIAAEVLTVPALSIGRQLSDAKLYLESVDLFAWTLTVILLSLLLELCMLGIMKGLRSRRGANDSRQNRCVSPAEVIHEQ